MILKEGGVFLVADAAGDVTGAGGSGLYDRDTRYLSRLTVAVNGRRPTACTHRQPTPAVAVLHGRVPGSDAPLAVHRTTVIDGGLHVNVTLRNPDVLPRRARVTVTLAADFRDMFAVRGFREGKARGTLHPPEPDGPSARFSYTATDGAPVWTTARASHVPDRVEPIRTGRRGETPGVRWTFRLALAPGACAAIGIAVTPGREDRVPVVPSVRAALLSARSRVHRWAAEVTAIETDNAAFNRLLRRSTHDLRALLTPCAAGEVPAAGIPWFVAPFGRDACIAAMEALPLTPRFAVGTLRALAAYQGTTTNPARDEEPGKIVHEIRVGELSRTNRVPFSTYYGSVDSTPLFVMLFAATMRWLDADALYDDLLPQVRRALAWCDTYGDVDGDGYVEFGRYAGGGLANQGWKDSHDSLHHADGADVLRPVALAEVQAYVYAAKAWLAEIVERRGDVPWAAQLRVEAADLAARFERDFWLPDVGCYAYALDAAKRPVATVVSNAGHLLACDLARGTKAELLAERLLQPDMLSGWGIRTLSASSPRYDPDSYHNGSIWPHDNALIALGMARAGQRRAATTVAAHVLEAGMAQPLCRIPELYAGYPRASTPAAPAPYPVSCAPQAWSAASAFAFLRALLGLDADGQTGAIACDPSLPPWLGRVTLRGMRYGRWRADIAVRRDGDTYAVAITRA